VEEAGCSVPVEFIGSEGCGFSAIAGPRLRAVKSTTAPMLKKTYFIIDLVELCFA
jgi:hypothetical protein